MNTLYQLLAIIGMVGVVGWMYFAAKNKPEMFSRDNLSKSFSTLGVLALILMLFVAFLIYVVR